MTKNTVPLTKYSRKITIFVQLWVKTQDIGVQHKSRRLLISLLQAKFSLDSGFEGLSQLSELTLNGGTLDKLNRHWKFDGKFPKKVISVDATLEKFSES
mmetsp:Transcript_44609/g.73719  ORF Transcript_44609/g.73719 Transcript_44609/m.73719 type:complete len:99 (-) Transcript_44609:12-308(-)